MARLGNAQEQLLRRAPGTWPARPSSLAGEDTSIISRVTKAGQPVHPAQSLPVWLEGLGGTCRVARAQKSLPTASRL